MIDIAKMCTDLFEASGKVRCNALKEASIVVLDAALQEPAGSPAIPVLRKVAEKLQAMSEEPLP